MRIATWNVNSVRSRLPRLLPWLEAQRPDLVCLQETKCRDEQFPHEPFDELGYNVEIYGQKTYNGVAILSKTRPDDVRKGFDDDDEEADRRLIAATVDDLQIVNAYVIQGRSPDNPNYERKLAFYDRLRDFVTTHCALDQPLVVCGDFNVTFDDRDVHDPEQWRDKIHCTDREREALGELCAIGLHDAFRKAHEEGGHYTWWDFRTRAWGRDAGLRIDHFLLTEAALDRVADCWVDRDARDGEKPSDHAPVILDLD